MNVFELFAGEGARIDGPDVPVAGLASDAQRVKPKDLFAAWAGGRHDGHAFIDEALRRGASCVLCERAVPSGGATRVVVPDVRRALARAAARFYGYPGERLTTVGVTGTNGKTTTVHLIEGMLAAAGRRPGIIGTLGSRFAGCVLETDGLTTPAASDLNRLLAQMVAQGAQSAVMEVSSHALAQGRVTGLMFDIAVFTNLSHDHLDFHGSLDAYFAAKASLLREHRKAGGRCVVNTDDPYGQVLQRELSAVGFGTAGDAVPGVRLLRQHSDGAGLRVVAQTPQGEVVVRSSLLGAVNVSNILAAIATGVALDLPLAVIEEGIGQVGTVSGRMQRVSDDGEPLVLVDYAHTPDALGQVLHAVRRLTDGLVLCVFGCGGDRDVQKRFAMGQVVGHQADWACVTSDNPRSEDPRNIAASVVAGLVAGGMSQAAPGVPRGYGVELDRERAIAQAVEVATPNDVVIIAGKGHETMQICGSQRRGFDDRVHARAALRRAALKRTTVVRKDSPKP